VNTRFWCEIFKERDELEDPSVDGRMLLKRIWLMIGTGSRFCVR